MKNFQLLKTRVLADGQIDDGDLAEICSSLYDDAKLDDQVIEFLVTLRNEAKTVYPAFEDFLFDAVRFCVLANGAVDAKKTALLKRVLQRTRRSTEQVRQLLVDLKRRARQVCPEFRRFYEEVVLNGREIRR